MRILSHENLNSLIALNAKYHSKIFPLYRKVTRKKPKKNQCVSVQVNGWLELAFQEGGPDRIQRQITVVGLPPFLDVA